jgi:hypothetical protein
MSVFVFLGPSLPLERAREVLDAIYLPPVQQGDVLRLLPKRPTVIGIVDGYFDTVPAVWHKEILLAMSQGVHVFGAASMGALRAAELHPFGMVGVGRVFELFRDGILTGDDEVAVAHGAADSGYRSSCDALVDIRDACEGASAEGVLPPGVAVQLVAIGSAMAYPDRSYRTVARQARAEGIDPSLVDRWLVYVAQRGAGLKQRNAEAMLRAIRSFLDTSLGPKHVDYTVERTVFVEQLRYELAFAEVTRLGRPPADDGERLRGGETLASLREKRLLRTLAHQEGERLGWRLSVAEVQEHADRFRAEHGIESPEALHEWMATEGLTEAAFWHYVQDACMIERLQRLHNTEIEAGLPDQLRIATARRDASGDDGAAGDGDSHSHPIGRTSERLAVIRKKILLRFLAIQEAERRGIVIPPADVLRLADRVRSASGLESADGLSAWLRAEGLSETAFLTAMQEFVAVERVQELYAEELEQRIADHTRINELVTGWPSEPSS